MEEYTAWVKVPSNLKTKTQLGKEGLRLAPNQKQVAWFCSYIRGKRRPQYYKLYDISEAVPKRVVTEAQLAHLAEIRKLAKAALTCKGCGETSAPRRTGRLVGGYCRWCRDHRDVVQWAREVLSDEKALILDTETTGLDWGAEVIEIAIVRITGEVLLDTLVKPQGEMGATHVHGITAQDVAGAPTWPEVDPQVSQLLSEASRIITYGADFDSSMVDQTRARWGLPHLSGMKWHCAMHAYAQFIGDWSWYHRSYRWYPLGGGHRALGDCLACLERIKRMAGSGANDSTGQ